MVGRPSYGKRYGSTWPLGGQPRSAGRVVVVVAMGADQLDAWSAAGYPLPSAARPLVAAWRLLARARQAKLDAAVKKHQKANEAADKAREEAKEARKVAMAEAKAEADKVKKAAKRAALKEARKVEKAAAIARGEPFADDEAQGVYMQTTPPAKARAARAAKVLEAELVPEVGGEVWDDDSAPW